MLWAERGIRPADVLDGDPAVVEELLDYLAEKGAEATDAENFARLHEALNRS